MAKEANVHLCIKVEKEVCPLGLAPTSSTTATPVMGMRWPWPAGRPVVSPPMTFAFASGRVPGKRFAAAGRRSDARGELLPQVG